MDERCFAMHWGECSALKVNCPGYQACKFYKPRWALEKEPVSYTHLTLPTKF